MIRHMIIFRSAMVPERYKEPNRLQLIHAVKQILNFLKETYIRKSSAAGTLVHTIDRRPDAAKRW